MSAMDILGFGNSRDYEWRSVNLIQTRVEGETDFDLSAVHCVKDLPMSDLAGDCLPSEWIQGILWWKLVQLLPYLLLEAGENGPESQRAAVESVLFPRVSDPNEPALRNIQLLQW